MGFVTALWALVVRGALTLDLGVAGGTGRWVRFRIAASPDVVFEVISGPYLGRTPRALAAKLEVLERGQDVVLVKSTLVA